MEQTACEVRSLDDWLGYLERIHPAAIELGLDRVGTVADRLGLRQQTGHVITVGGTNGKGSTCALLREILEQAGYSVGTYSSPHLVRYNERVTLNGSPVDDSDFCQAFGAIERARGEVSLSYFEFGTLAALWLFKKFSPDVILLEVGLGGRLDATNIVDSKVAAITSIALDHCDWLGDSLESIGFEKAGIFRKGAPAISGEPNPPESIAQTAKSCEALLLQRGAEFDCECFERSWSYRGPDWQLSDLPYPNIPLIMQ